MKVQPTGEIIAVNGFDMYYEICGEGKPLLLLHGFMGSSAGLAELFKDLAQRHQLIIPDLRGHGRSTNPVKQFTHRQAALDIVALLDHLEIETCCAVGFSAGGNALLHMAIQQPNRVEAMAVVSATPYFPEQTRELMRQFSRTERLTEEWQAMRKIHLQGDEQIKMLWQQAGAFSESVDDLNLTPLDLKKIKAKTLIVQGDRDPLYPLEISVEMYRHISGASLWIVPNGGHVPFTPDSIQPFSDFLMSYLRE